jgi:hypothetical protein
VAGADKLANIDLKPSEAMAYQVLSANSIREMEKQVNVALKSGRHLYGFPSQSKDSICQAVVEV